MYFLFTGTTWHRCETVQKASSARMHVIASVTLFTYRILVVAFHSSPAQLCWWRWLWLHASLNEIPWNEWMFTLFHEMSEYVLHYSMKWVNMFTLFRNEWIYLHYSVPYYVVSCWLLYTFLLKNLHYHVCFQMWMSVWMTFINVMTMPHVTTPMDRICVHVCLDTAEMERFVKVSCWQMSCLINHSVVHSVGDYVLFNKSFFRLLCSV